MAVPKPGESPTRTRAPWSSSQRQTAATTTGLVQARGVAVSRLGLTSTWAEHREKDEARPARSRRGGRACATAPLSAGEKRCRATAALGAEAGTS